MSSDRGEPSAGAIWLGMVAFGLVLYVFFNAQAGSHTPSPAPEDRVADQQQGSTPDPVPDDPPNAQDWWDGGGSADPVPDDPPNAQDWWDGGGSADPDQAVLEASISDPESCLIKGNVSYNTGELIYHVPGQAYYDATIIDEAYGERWFCTEEEAVAAGWRRSEV